jgi:hypothetical protein
VVPYKITQVKPDGMFASLNIQKGDLLAAIITPKDAWNVTIRRDLRYLAERWTPEQMGGSEVKVIVIRDKVLLEGSLTVANTGNGDELEAR